MILTPYFIKKEIKRMSSAHAKRAHSFRSLGEVKNALLFFDAPDLTRVLPCIRQLEERNILVTACAYANKEVTDWPSSILLIREKTDTNLFGIPHSTIAEQINRIPSDLLIDLTGEKSYPMHLLVLRHPSGFKVGGKTDLSEQIHDLSIIMTNKNDIDYLFGQILFYLQAIHSK